MVGGEEFEKGCDLIEKIPARRVQVRVKVPPPVVLKGQQLLYSSEPKYLGVTVDEGLTFKAHVATVAERMASRCKVLRALTGTSWGCRLSTLRRTYWGYVRSVAEYAAAAWRPFINKDTAYKLEVQQGDAAAVITGCHRNTKTAALLAEAGLMSLGDRAKELLAKAKQRYERLPPGCPAQRWVEYIRKSASVTELEEAAGLKGVEPEPWQTCSPLDPWSSDTNVEFHTKLAEPCKKSMLALRKLRIANKTLQGLGEFDVELWTDGSAEGGVRKGGAGVIIRDLRSDTQHPPISVAAGEVVSPFRAEEVGIWRALQELERWRLPEGSRVLLCCDSLSAVHRLAQGPDAQVDRVAHDIWALLAQLFPSGGGSQLVVQWCPSHCGLAHNCEADDAAKAGSRMDQEAVAVDYASAATALQRASRRRAEEKLRRDLKEHWYAKATDFKPVHGKLNLARWEAVMLARLRSHNCRLVPYAARKVDPETPERCAKCGSEDVSHEHWLCSCPNLTMRRLRQQHLGGDPDPSIVRRKPYAVIAYLEAVMRAFPLDNKYPQRGQKWRKVGGKWTMRPKGPQKPRVEMADARILSAIVKQHEPKERKRRTRRGPRPPPLPRGAEEPAPAAPSVVAPQEGAGAERLKLVEAFQIVAAMLQSVRTAREDKRKRLEAVSKKDPAHKLLRQRAAAENMTLKDVLGDGHCLFRAVARQLQLKGRRFD
eukprot:gene10748-1822_t